MNGNNVRTSVVVEVANQEEPDDQKMYKIDFDDVEPPKGFVIDQIYCGEDVTVYALFEVSELTNGDLEKQLVEVSSSGLSEDLKFYNKSSCIKGNNWTTSCDKDLYLPISKQQSLYCLQHLGGGYEKSSVEENKDMKVLYSKDMMPKSTGFKSVSVGVNTDIAQCPKLLEEVQRAVSLNFYSSKKNLLGMASLSHAELEEFESSSFSSLEAGEKNSDDKSPNFLIIPLIMMEDGVLSQLKKEKKEKLEKSVVKISQGVNTSMESFDHEERKPEIKGDYFLNHPTAHENQFIEGNFREANTNIDDTKSQSLDKKSILEEIKKLQLKLNCLIQSLEQSNCNDNESNVTTTILDSSPGFKESNALLNFPVNDEQEPLPAYSSYSLITDPFLQNLIEAQPSTHLVNSVTRNVSSTTQKLDDSISFKNLKDEFVDWEFLLSKKSPRTSKSESRNCCIEQKTIPGIKRSMSLNLKEVKPDATGFKKLKNAYFKLEGSVKSKETTRILLNEENLLSDKFPLLKCEMGDEAQEKLQCSKVKFNFMAMHSEPEDLKSVCKAIKNEEEGDATVLKANSEKLAVHFCSANVASSNKVVKEEKSVLKIKPGIAEKGIKNESVKSSKKVNDTTTKKDVKVSSKAKSKSKTENQMKSGVAEVSDETKQKFTPVSRKSTTRNPVENRQFIDKLQKKSVECSKTKQSQLKQEKLPVKEDTSRLSRPLSQKRERRDAACVDAKEKLGNTRKGTTGNVMVLEKKLESVKETIPPKREHRMASSNPSSVIVELFSKKPTTVDEINQKCKTNSGGQKAEDEAEKSVAKSVWALTKVLLYEDGTKKFEVLEASLTPPEYSLQSGKKEEVGNL